MFGIHISLREPNPVRPSVRWHISDSPNEAKRREEKKIQGNYKMAEHNIYTQGALDEEKICVKVLFFFNKKERAWPFFFDSLSCLCVSHY